MELAPGAPFGRYRVERLLGRGGMGAVYEVSEPGTGQRFALKVLLAVDQPDALRRFLREARAMGAIGHPHLLSIREVLERGAGSIDAPALVLELCPGGSLRDQLRGRGRLPWAEAARLGAQVARGLAALHAAGYVHRDLKPENVLLGADGAARVADLGIVRPVAPSAQSAAPALTQAGGVIGTPGYMAPEQLKGLEVDARADLWSLGALLHVLVAGQPPWPRARGLLELMEQLHRDRPAPLRALVPDCPAALEALVLRLLTTDRDERPDQALEVALELERLLARPAAAGGPRPGAALALGALALALGAGLTVALYTPSPPVTPPPPAVTTAPGTSSGTPASAAAAPRAEEPEAGAGSDDVPPLPTLGDALELAVTYEAAGPEAATLVVEASRPITRLVLVPLDPLHGPRAAIDPPTLEPPPRRARIRYTGLAPGGARVAFIAAARDLPNVRHDELLLAPPPVPGLTVGHTTPVAARRGARPGKRQRPTGVRVHRWPLPAGGPLDLVWVPDGAGGGVYLGGTEVRRGTWRAFCDATGRAAPPAPAWATSDELPVAGVSLEDARAFCAWAGLRLPTDDELERAARGLDGRRFPWGDDLPDATRAVFGADRPGPCGGLPGGASPWGALDLSGNVWEWTEGGGARGGGWSSSTDALAASSRRSPPPLEETGLRVALDPPTAGPR